MKKITGWILDAQIHHTGICLWITTKNNTTIKAIYSWRPAFYAILSNKKMQDRWNYKYYKQILEKHEDIRSIDISERFIKPRDRKKSLTLKIEMENPQKFKKVIQHLTTLEYFTLFNTDLPLVQMFFYEMDLFPLALCKFTFKKKKKKDNYISDIQLLDKNTDLEYDLPPLKIIWLKVNTQTTDLKVMRSDKIISCTINQDKNSTELHLSSRFPLYDKGKEIIIKEESERETLQSLQDVVELIDPDIIFTIRGDEVVFPHLLSRLSACKLLYQFSLSRDGKLLRNSLFNKSGNNHYFSYGQVFHRSSTQFYLNGRIHIDVTTHGSLHFKEGNLYGLIEIARISYITLQRLTRITIGGALQSMQFYHAYKEDILISEEKKNSEFLREASTLLKSDRGGHIINPKVGMFQNVAELDFTSMYPSLMVEYNVSSEAINCECCKNDSIQEKVPGIPYYLCTKKQGIIPKSLIVPLEKRIAYKKMRNEDPKYDEMQTALKWILVVCFGYLGFRNARFGRIEAHQTVTAYAREFLLNSMEIIESYGLKILHGIVDSLYVQCPKDMPITNFHNKCQLACKEIVNMTKIPISYNPKSDFFKIITFLPTKKNVKIGALNRYWGIKPTGALKVRGVEIRRRDTPPFIKTFQIQLLDLIGNTFLHNLSAKNQYSEDKLHDLIQRVLLPHLLQNYNLLENRTIPYSDLAISIRMTRRPSQYKVMNYQAIAGTHLEQLGEDIYPGKKISFIIVNDRAEHPLNRVLPLKLYDPTKHNYDINKYKELLVRALTNLIPLEFSPEIKRNLMNIKTQKTYENKTKKCGTLTSFM